jgi:hypothetical protein
MCINGPAQSAGPFYTVRAGNQILMKLNFLSKTKFTLCRAQYIYLALAGISIFLGLFAQVRAQEPTSATIPLPTPNAEERVDTMRTQQAERVEARDERRAGLTAELQARWINLVSNAEGRIRAAHGRLLNVTARLETRIEKLNAVGVDTSSAEASLRKAKDMLDDVVAQLNDISTIGVGGLAGEIPKEHLKQLRSKFVSARESLMSAKNELRVTVALLKTAISEAELGRGVSDAVRNENSATNTQKETEE